MTADARKRAAKTVWSVARKGASLITARVRPAKKSQPGPSPDVSRPRGDSSALEVPVAVALLDDDRNIVAANRGFCMMMEAGESQLIGRPIAAFTRPEDARVSTVGRTAEKRYVSVAGREFRVRVTTSNVRWTDGKTYWVKILQEPSEIGVSPTAMEISESILRQVLDATPDWIFLKGLDRKYQLVNRSYANALGLSPDAMIGRDDLDLGFDPALVKGDPERGIRGFWADDDLVASSMKTHSFPDDAADVNGEIRTFHTVKTPVFDERGRLRGVLGYARDITDLKHAEVRMLQASKMASLGEMAGGIAHEINNPLAVIHGKAGQLLRSSQRGELPPEKAVAHLEKIIATTERIARIIKGLRTFSRNAEFDAPEKVAIKSVVEDALGLCSERFLSKGVQVAASAAPDAFVKGRPAELAQVLLNLLNNAFDAVQSDENPWIRVDAQFEPERVRIVVTDSGRGIPRDVAARMMDPFFTTKPVGVGTGLGLSISKGIVEAHGGRLYLDTGCENTRFVMELPRDSAEQDGSAA